MLLNFAWKCFSTTGSIEAYLLYKELKGLESCPDKEENQELKAASDKN